MRELMSQPKRFIRRLLRAAAGARRRGRGSILIMVVAVLVLMALMGTAFISVARLDRYAGPAINDQTPPDSLDTLLPAVGDSIKFRITQDLYQNVMYRPVILPTWYEHFDSYLSNPGFEIAHDAWLMPRLPIQLPLASGGSVPAWRGISRPLEEPLADTDPLPRFESPYRLPRGGGGFGTIPTAVGDPLATYPQWELKVYDQDPSDGTDPAQAAVPTQLAITYPTNYIDPAMAGKTRVYPAMMVYASGDVLRYPNDAAAEYRGRPVKYLAGDADGDGVADAGLVYLATIDGVRYYYGTRIIDNNSAINANTAWSRNFDFDYSTANGALVPNKALFPSNVGLAELLSDFNNAATDSVTLSNQMNLLNQFRLNGPPVPSEEPVQDPNPVSTTTADDRSFVRPDFEFMTFGDAVYHMKDRRLDVPGIKDPVAVADPNDDVPYRAFTLVDGSELAYRFGLANVARSTPTSEIEQALYPAYAGIDSIYESAANWMPDEDNRFRYFTANDLGGASRESPAYWYAYNFEFDTTQRTSILGGQYGVNPIPPIPLRSILTARNPVSNYIQPHFHPLDRDGIAATRDPINRAPAGLAAAAPDLGMLPYDADPPEVWSAATAYTRGMLARWPDPAAATPAGVPSRTYMCIVDIAAGGAPPVNPATGVINRANWDYQPYTNDPVRTSLNSGTFRELWRAYWNVMVNGDSESSPFGPDADEPGGTAGVTYPADPNERNNYSRLPYHPQRMFRSSIRDYRYDASAGTVPEEEGVRFTAGQMTQLRAALAAVNTIDLRDTDSVESIGGVVYKIGDVTSKKIILAARGDLDGDGTVDAPNYPPGVPPAEMEGVAVEVTVFGYEPQPFITEVYADTVTGYVGIELYNPYPYAMNLRNWTLGLIDRRPASLIADPGPTRDVDDPVAPLMRLRPLTGLEDGFTSGAVGTWETDFNDEYNAANTVTDLIIPAQTRVVLHNLGAPGPTGLAVSLPAADVMIPADPNLAYVVPGLHEAIQNTGPVLSEGGELVLLRPRRQNPVVAAAPGGELTATPVGPTAPVDHEYNESDAAYTPSARMAQMVPVDQFDFTGVVAGEVGSAQKIHYQRSATAAGVAPAWQFVYPGPYDGREGTGLPAERFPRQTAEATVFNYNDLGWGTHADPPFELGEDGAAQVAWYAPIFTTQLANHYWPGPNPAVAAVGNQWPFGGFTRNGDVMQVPFIGAYKIVRVDPTTLVPLAADGLEDFVEMNSITADASMADDTDPMNDGGADVTEQLGRFCLVGDPTAGTGDYAPGLLEAAGRYLWARDIFDYLTVQAPHDDHTPDVDVAQLDPVLPLRPVRPGATGPTRLLDYPGPPEFPTVPLPQDTASLTLDSPNDGDESAGVDGLVNVNTAPWPVLAALPLVVDPATGVVNADETAHLARAIVHYRDIDNGTGIPNGPFRSMFELNKVVDTLRGQPGSGFKNIYGRLPAGATDNPGDLSPPGVGATDGVADFEDSYAQTIRLSNLLTLRSDTFTCYWVVQGWKEVGTPHPQLVAERRGAFLLDRSGVAPGAQAEPVITPVPTQ